MNVSFDTDRFNLTQVHEHFINSCCFGEDVATWLKSELENRGTWEITLYQEDWGWELELTLHGKTYFVGVGGVSKRQNLGRWTLILQRKRTLMDRFRGKSKTVGRDSPLFKDIVEILDSSSLSWSISES